MSQEKHAYAVLTDDTYEEEVKNFPGVVMVDYWAGWCAPCLAMAPAVEQLANKYKDNKDVKIAKLDTDAYQQTAMQEQIMALPTFKFFVNGEEVGEINGARPAAVLEQQLNSAIARLSENKKAA